MTVTVDSRGFTRLVADLQKISGKDYDHVLRNTVGRVLGKAIEYTPSMKPDEIPKRVAAQMRRYNTFAEDGSTGKDTSGKTPRVWRSEKTAKRWGMETPEQLEYWKYKPERYTKNIINGKKFYILTGNRRWNSPRRWPKYKELMDRQDAAISAAKGKTLAAVKNSRGLSKRSWLQIADVLGIPVKVAGYIRNARPSNGHEYQNGSGTRQISGKTIFYEIINTMPTLIRSKSEKLQGSKILTRAIKARISAFTTELKRGVFSDVKYRASRYPGIFVAPG